MSKDILKFYQSSIPIMAEIGGFNFISPVFSRMGLKLGQIYCKKGVKKVKKALEYFIEGMGGKPEIKDIKNENSIEFQVFSGNSCPIGGEPSNNKYKVNGTEKQKHEIFLDGLCKPYVKGFLKAYDLDVKIESLGCILQGNCSYCRLKITV